ncbi:expressed unknown protein [Seminavis robusta]|uniref:Right handed beta helix domain-containing protein n=1 Tax=Seminavis robusta TaxID=568900 RepID=A0A9N8ET61_9STRA|nr:expressed unknown protein [Seminavis robusta]|eukprot:Sro1804_g298680.1 n/a (631) ;mRNA; f:11502-13510
MTTTLRQSADDWRATTTSSSMRSDFSAPVANKQRSVVSLAASHQSRPVQVATATLSSSSEGGGVAPPEHRMDRRLSISSVASSSASQIPTTSASITVKTGRPPRFRRRRSSKKNKMANSVMVKGGPPENVMQWLEICCPNDVLPKVLAFCGPQMTATLMATNRYWFHLIAHNDGIWRGLCEGLYKWKEGQDEMPESWKEYYRLHPCVPIDYPTIPRAMAIVTKKRSNNHQSVSQYIRPVASKKEQTQSVEILLRPGKHVVKESLVVTAAPNVTVTLKTMELPKNRFYSPKLAFAEQQQAQSSPEPKSKGRNSPLRQYFLGCKSAASAVPGNLSSDAEHISFDDSETSEQSLVFLNQNNNNNDGHRGSLSIQDTHRIQMLATSPSMTPPQYPERATLVLRTRRLNEPVVRIRQGAFRLCKVDLVHASQGVDIWNGNAAIQVQPPMGADNVPEPVVPKPSALLDHIAISSKSGRGVVCLDGGTVELERCMIHDCAATGLYIGGPGSSAYVTHTDVIRNGIGSRLPPSTRTPRVTSGHSGVYLEQGLAQISECNISSNHLTGISAVSFENAILKLSKSDLVANGNGNLEMPPPGTLSYDKSDIAKDNNLASVGRPCLRSNLELPARIRPRASF